MPSSCESSCETLMSNLTEVNAQKLSLPLNSTFEVSRAETIGKSGCGSLSNRQNCGGAAVIVSHVSQVATQAPQNQSFMFAPREYTFLIGLGPSEYKHVGK